MADFSAGAVIAMLGLVEGSIAAGLAWISAQKADDEDVADNDDRLDEHHERIEAVERATGRHGRVLDDADLLPDGGRER